MVKMTFSLDEATAVRIRRTAERLGKAQSHVVREAVADYAARTDRLSERDRLRILEVLERVRGSDSTRSAEEVDAEMQAVRAARRRGGRRHQGSASGPQAS